MKKKTALEILQGPQKRPVRVLVWDDDIELYRCLNENYTRDEYNKLDTDFRGCFDIRPGSPKLYTRWDLDRMKQYRYSIVESS